MWSFIKLRVVIRRNSDEEGRFSWHRREGPYAMLHRLTDRSFLLGRYFKFEPSFRTFQGGEGV
jgi:hypothetical protein